MPMEAKMILLAMLVCRLPETVSTVASKIIWRGVWDLNPLAFLLDNHLNHK